MPGAVRFLYGLRPYFTDDEQRASFREAVDAARLWLLEAADVLDPEGAS